MRIIPIASNSIEIQLLDGTVFTIMEVDEGEIKIHNVNGVKITEIRNSAYIKAKEEEFV